MSHRRGRGQPRLRPRTQSPRPWIRGHHHGVVLPGLQWVGTSVFEGNLGLEGVGVVVDGLKGGVVGIDISGGGLEGGKGALDLGL